MQFRSCTSKTIETAGLQVNYSNVDTEGIISLAWPEFCADHAFIDLNDRGTVFL